MIELNGVQISDNNINTKKNVKIYVDEKYLNNKIDPSLIDKIDKLEDNICETLEYTVSEEGVPSLSPSAQKLIETDEQRAHNAPIYQKLINNSLKHVHINVLIPAETGLLLNYEIIGHYYNIDNSGTPYGIVQGVGLLELNSAILCGVCFTADGLYGELMDGVGAFMDQIEFVLSSEVTALESRIAELENIISQITTKEE